ncbi:chemotaxis protein MotB [Kineococcus radiotolerans]|uniref:Chemotaxis protein MotB n=1 Tax=Kineococcus radiotolerans TaxID=131568 RepID=A0A7W4XVR7_KINRA|nr:flagellar motor protein MotB [Kineococcus radiotolerans]MBB2899642.1 chemotaxis protein MotB [Kineococcus radiotolerans]
MSAAHKRRHKHEEHEEHANHERWLVAYADMLTVLMALFIVLFALSQIDQLKFAQFKDGLTKGTSSSNQAVSGSAGILEATNGDMPIDITPNSTGQPLQQSVSSEVRKILQAAQTAQTQEDLKAAQEEVEDYREIAKQIDAALTAKGDQDQVTYRITSDGLVVGLVADNVFFANASAEVEEKGREVLDVIAPILAQLPNDIAVQGHTNSLPLSATTRYRDNWDLSAARAMTVVQRFTAAGIPGNHLSGTGYADSRPLYPNEDPKALTGNRRVDLVVASPSSDAVKALLPEVAAGIPTGDGPAELTGTSGTSGSSTTTSTVSTTDVAIDVAAGIAPDLATDVAH